MRDSRDRRRWRTGAYLCGCVTLWIECSFRRWEDGGVLLERIIGKFAKVMLYRARECLFAEYVMIGTLGRGRLRHPRWDFCGTSLYHRPANILILHSRCPSYRLFSTVDCLASRSRTFRSGGSSSRVTTLSYSPLLLSSLTHQFAVSALLNQLCFPLDPFVTFPCFCIAVLACLRKLTIFSPNQALLQINAAYSPKLTPSSTLV